MRTGTTRVVVLIAVSGLFFLAVGVLIGRTDALFGSDAKSVSAGWSGLASGSVLSTTTKIVNLSGSGGNCPDIGDCKDLDGDGIGDIPNDCIRATGFSFRVPEGKNLLITDIVNTHGTTALFKIWTQRRGVFSPFRRNPPWLW